MLFGIFGSSVKDDDLDFIDSVENTKTRAVFELFQRLHQECFDVLDSQLIKAHQSVDNDFDDATLLNDNDLRVWKKCLDALSTIRRSTVKVVFSAFSDRGALQELTALHLESLDKWLNIALKMVISIVEPLVSRARYQIEQFMMSLRSKNRSSSPEKTSTVIRKDAPTGITRALLMKIVELLLPTLSIVTLCDDLVELMKGLEILTHVPMREGIITITIDSLNVISLLLEDESKSIDLTEDHDIVFEERILNNGPIDEGSSSSITSNCVSRARVMIPLLLMDPELSVLSELTVHGDTRVMKEAIIVLEQIIRCDYEFASLVREAYSTQVAVVARMMEIVKQDVDRECLRLEQYFEHDDSVNLYDASCMTQASSRRAMLRIVLLLTWPEVDFQARNTKSKVSGSPSLASEEPSMADQFCRLAFMNDTLDSSLTLVGFYFRLNSLRASNLLTKQSTDGSETEVDLLQMDAMISLNTSDLITFIRNIYLVRSIQNDLISNPKSLTSLILKLRNILELATTIDLATYIDCYESKQIDYLTRYCQRWTRHHEKTTMLDQGTVKGAPVSTQWYASIPRFDVSKCSFTIDVKNCLEICINLLSESASESPSSSVPTVNASVALTYLELDLIPTIRSLLHDLKNVPKRVSLIQNNMVPPSVKMAKEDETVVRRCFTKLTGVRLESDCPLLTVELLDSEVFHCYGFLTQKLDQLTVLLQKCPAYSTFQHVSLFKPSSSDQIQLQQMIKARRWNISEDLSSVAQLYSKYPLDTKTPLSPSMTTTNSKPISPSECVSSLSSESVEFRSLILTKNNQLATLSQAYRYLEQELASRQNSISSMQEHMNDRFANALHLLGTIKYHYDKGHLVPRDPPCTEDTMPTDLTEFNALLKFLDQSMPNDTRHVSPQADRGKTRQHIKAVLWGSDRK